MSESGLSSADLRKRAAISTARRSGEHQEEVDPLKDAIRTRREMAALKIVDQSVAETSTDALKAQTAQMQAEIDFRKTQELKQGKADDGLQQYILQQISNLEAKLAEAHQAAADQQFQVLQERMTMLNAELGRLQEERMQPPIDVTDLVVREIDKAETLLSRARPMAQEVPPAPTTEDPTLKAWMIQSQHDHEIRMAQRQEDHEVRLRQIEREEALRREELTVQREHLARQDKFFSDTAPQALEIVKGFAQRFLGGNNSEARPQVSPPPGFSAMTCQECGAVIFYRKEAGEAVCSSCGAVHYDDGQDHVPDAQPAPATHEVAAEEE